MIFTSDNGGERFADTWPFTGRKTELLEGGLRIPAVISWPARIAAGTVVDQVAITMDWLPTLLAAAGTSPDPAFPPDVMNLLPALSGKAAVAERAASSGAIRRMRSEQCGMEISKFLKILSG